MDELERVTYLLREGIGDPDALLERLRDLDLATWADHVEARASAAHLRDLTASWGGLLERRAH